MFSFFFANSGDPDQTPHSAASDMGLHCLPNTLLGVSRLQWDNSLFKYSFRRSILQNAVHFYFVPEIVI